MLANGMTVTFSTLLMALMSPSSLAVVLDDDYKDSDYYQNEAKDEMDEFEDEICPQADHPHLKRMLQKYAVDEKNNWEQVAREARVGAAKDFDATWKSMYTNVSDEGTDEAAPDTAAGSDCRCCYKHPVVIKLGARLVQHMFPDMAANISKHLENITTAMKKQPDHSIEYMMKQLNESKRKKAKSESLTDQSQTIFGATACQMDLVTISMDMLSLVLAGMSVVNVNKVAEVAAPSKYKVVNGAYAVKDMIKGFIDGQKVAGKVIKVGLVAKKVGAIIYHLWGVSSKIYHESVSQYKSTLYWWEAAVDAVKLMAQIAVWFLSGMWALVATLIGAIFSLAGDVTKMIGDDNCFDGNSSRWSTANLPRV
jgi:hypothetical protein